MTSTSVKPGSATDLRQAVASNTPEAVERWLASVRDPAERDHQLTGLAARARRRLGELLDEHTGPELLESVDKHIAAKVLQAMTVPSAVALINALDSDRAAEILREIDERAREALLAAMPAPEAAVLRGLLAWPQNCAAAHMMPETLTVNATSTAAQAVAEVRAQAADLRGHARTGAYIYVTGPDHRLLGVLPFRNLVLADGEQAVTELIAGDVITVAPLTDKEEAAQVLIDHRLLALPVVDTEGRLLGIITEDDAADIVEEEATEDAEKQGGSAPLEVPYLLASPWLLWRKRIVWLLVLFVAEAYTGTVLRAFEHELDTVVALAFFIPLLIGTGGNTGTQIVTTLIRAMATGHVRMPDLPAVLLKEMSTGVLIAVSMALAAVIRAWTLGVGPEVTLTVSLSVAAIVLWSSLIASVLPPVLQKLRIDPAVVSAPMITTLVDGTGLIIYFTIAKLTLSQLAGV